MKCFRVCVLVLGIALVLVGAAVCGDPDDVPVGEGKIEDFAWLAGHWQGEAFGGVCEEVWSPASGGTMVGTFKLMHNDAVSFYEIMIISRDTAGMVLKVKHFNDDLTGWEEKDDFASFRYVESGERKVEFSGLSYARVSDDSLKITVSVKAKDGTARKEVIDCQLVTPGQ